MFLLCFSLLYTGRDGACTHARWTAAHGRILSTRLTPRHPNPTGKTIRTNRLSVTERFKPLHREGQPRLQGDSHAHEDRTSVLPGVFFIYDLSPFAVRVLACSLACLGRWGSSSRVAPAPPHVNTFLRPSTD